MYRAKIRYIGEKVIDTFDGWIFEGGEAPESEPYRIGTGINRVHGWFLRELNDLCDKYGENQWITIDPCEWEREQFLTMLDGCNDGLILFLPKGEYRTDAFDIGDVATLKAIIDEWCKD